MAFQSKRLFLSSSTCSLGVGLGVLISTRTSCAVWFILTVDWLNELWASMGGGYPAGLYIVSGGAVGDEWASLGSYSGYEDMEEEGGHLMVVVRVREEGGAEDRTEAVTRRRKRGVIRGWWYNLVQLGTKCGGGMKEGGVCIRSPSLAVVKRGLPMLAVQVRLSHCDHGAIGSSSKR